MITTARNATLDDLAKLLTNQHARKVDVVAPASQFSFVNGELVVAGAEAELSLEGVTTTDGRYLPTSVFDEGLAEKLGIPLAYVRRMREHNIGLYDANANSWLAQDGRKFLLRCFRDDQGGTGVARAMLSNSYKLIDNLDVLTAALSGVKEAGVDVNIERCDLTDRRMYVKVSAPSVAALAPTLLGDYVSPFTKERGADNPMVFAGFILSNSETGGGAFTITPQITVQICKNGMTMTKDALRNTHLGGKLEDGVIRWSEETQAKNLELVTSQARDAVGTFLDVEYVSAKIAELEQLSTTPVADAAESITQVGKKLAFDEATTKGVLDFFIQGADLSAGGVLHAVTAFAQTIEDADRAYDIEAQGVRAMEVAAAL